MNKPAMAATPAATLEEQIMSETVPKNEREWWAHREIEALRLSLDGTRLEVDELRGALGSDHWLVSGRIDGIREALEVMRSGISRHAAEERLEARISELMNLEK